MSAHGGKLRRLAQAAEVSPRDQQVRLGQRVAEYALERGAGARQRGADHERADDPGQAEVEEEARRPIRQVTGGISAMPAEADEGLERLADP
jgi:hypothetical protein